MKITSKTMRIVQGLIGPQLIISHVTNKTKLINQVTKFAKALKSARFVLGIKNNHEQPAFSGTQVTMLSRKHEVWHQVTKPLNDWVLFEETEMPFRSFRLWKTKIPSVYFIFVLVSIFNI